MQMPKCDAHDLSAVVKLRTRFEESSLPLQTESARDLPRKALANILAVTQFTSHVACPQKYTHRRSSFSICKQTGSDMGSLHYLLRLAIPGQWPKIAGPVGPGQHVRPINGTIKNICT
jgi:hypothetical protein